MVKRKRYTTVQLAREYLRDLVTDIRVADRLGHDCYARECRAEFREIWPTRHAPTIKHGAPVS